MIRSFLKTVFSVKGLAFLIPAVIGILCLALNGSVYGVPFLLQLIALACAYWIVFFAVFLLARGETKFRIPAKILMWVMISVVIILFVLFVIVESNIIAHHNGDNEIPDSADTLIVLGCGVRGETPSPMLEYRLEAALEWMQLHPDTIAVLCGGQGPGEDITEAECMRRWLVDRGIDDDRLLLETLSESTRENIENAIAILNDKYPETDEIVVVTSGFHLYRSKLLCEKAGYRAYGISAAMPRIPFFRLNYYCREFASVFFMYGSEIFA